MPNVGYGDTVRDRAWHLVATLMNREGKEGVKSDCTRAEKYYLTVKATLQEMADWAEELSPEPKLEPEDVRQSLTMHLGNAFLKIMTDKRKQKAGRGAEQWEFDLQLWSINSDINKDKFYELWKKSKDQVSSKSSQASNSNHQSISNNLLNSHQQETEDRVDVIFIYCKENEKEVIEIEEQLKKEGLKVTRPSRDKRAGMRPAEWESEVMKQNSSVAVLVGRNGSDLWKDKKKLSFLNKFHKFVKSDKRFLIPVLLSDAPSNAFGQKDVPRYLKNFSGDETVDFTQGISPENINRFIFAITGKQPSRKQKLETIFSCKDKNEKIGNSGNSIEILLPAYPLEKEVSKLNLEKQFTTKSNKQKALENLMKSETQTSIFNDIVAYSSLNSLLQQNYLPTPLQPMKDSEKINFIDQKEGTYILIGLSNSQLDEINALPDNYVKEKFFQISTDEQTKEGLHPFYFKCANYNVSKQSIDPIDDWLKCDKDNLALFAKFEVGRKKIIVCGGNTETATRKLAWYINYSWDMVYRNLKNEKDRELDSNDSFAVAIETPRDEQSLVPENFKFVQLCIRRA